MKILLMSYAQRRYHQCARTKLDSDIGATGSFQNKTWWPPTTSVHFDCTGLQNLASNNWALVFLVLCAISHVMVIFLCRRKDQSCSTFKMQYSWRTLDLKAPAAETHHPPWRKQKAGANHSGRRRTSTFLPRALMSKQ